ncbi:hypothetical protein NEOKW01_0557 [Nematocida sp. AWRm80]|nr:hypothetical protein NEOKW01_0557 [Nematocida sp. AWRm80]
MKRRPNSIKYIYYLFTLLFTTVLLVYPSSASDINTSIDIGISPEEPCDQNTIYKEYLKYKSNKLSLANLKYSRDYSIKLTTNKGTNTSELLLSDDIQGIKSIFSNGYALCKIQRSIIMPINELSSEAQMELVLFMDTNDTTLSSDLRILREPVVYPQVIQLNLQIIFKYTETDNLLLSYDTVDTKKNTDKAISSSKRDKNKQNKQEVPVESKEEEEKKEEESKKNKKNKKKKEEERYKIEELMSNVIYTLISSKFPSLKYLKLQLTDHCESLFPVTGLLKTISVLQLIELELCIKSINTLYYDRQDSKIHLFRSGIIDTTPLWLDTSILSIILSFRSGTFSKLTKITVITTGINRISVLFDELPLGKQIQLIVSEKSTSIMSQLVIGAISNRYTTLESNLVYDLSLCIKDLPVLDTLIIKVSDTDDYSSYDIIENSEYPTRDSDKDTRLTNRYLIDRYLNVPKSNKDNLLKEFPRSYYLANALPVLNSVYFSTLSILNVPRLNGIFYESKTETCIYFFSVQVINSFTLLDSNILSYGWMTLISMLPPHKSLVIEIPSPLEYLKNVEIPQYNKEYSYSSKSKEEEIVSKRDKNINPIGRGTRVKKETDIMRQQDRSSYLNKIFKKNQMINKRIKRCFRCWMVNSMLLDSLKPSVHTIMALSIKNYLPRSLDTLPVILSSLNKLHTLRVSFVGSTWPNDSFMKVGKKILSKETEKKEPKTTIPSLKALELIGYKEMDLKKCNDRFPNLSVLRIVMFKETEERERKDAWPIRGYKYTRNILKQPSTPGLLTVQRLYICTTTLIALMNNDAGMSILKTVPEIGVLLYIPRDIHNRYSEEYRNICRYMPLEEQIARESLETGSTTLQTLPPETKQTKERQAKKNLISKLGTKEHLHIFLQNISLIRNYKVSTVVIDLYQPYTTEEDKQARECTVNEIKIKENPIELPLDILKLRMKRNISSLLPQILEGSIIANTLCCEIPYPQIDHSKIDTLREIIQIIKPKVMLITSSPITVSESQEDTEDTQSISGVSLEDIISILLFIRYTATLLDLRVYNLKIRSIERIDYNTLLTIISSTKEIYCIPEIQNIQEIASRYREYIKQKKTQKQTEIKKNTPKETEESSITKETIPEEKILSGIPPITCIKLLQRLTRNNEETEITAWAKTITPKSYKQGHILNRTLILENTQTNYFPYHEYTICH